MRESRVQQELIKTLKRDGHFAFKVPDMIRTGSTRFIPKKPFDIHATINGLSVGIEVKLLWNKSLDKYRTADMLRGEEKKSGLAYHEGNQYRSLQSIENAGGFGGILLNHRVNRLVNVVYWLSVTDIDIVAAYEKQSKQLSAEYIEDECRIGTGHHGCFELKKLYDMLEDMT